MPKRITFKVSRRVGSYRLSDHVPKSAPKPSPSWRVSDCGRRGYVNGFLTRIYRLDDIATLWDTVTLTIVKSWYWSGLLPPPFIYGRSRRDNEVPYWTAPQMRVIHSVLNAHWLAGHAKFGIGHRRTIETLYERGEKARHNLITRMNRASRKLYRKGIEWVDSPHRSLHRIDRKNTKIVKWDRNIEFEIEE